MNRALAGGSPATPLDRSARDPSEERELVARVRQGDRSAAEELVEMTYAAIYASLFRLAANADLAADLTQETYRKAWQSFRGFDGRSRVFTWLYRIAYTTFLNHLRGAKRTEPLSPVHEVSLLSPGIPADEAVTREESHERLRKAVLELPEDLRFAVCAHFWGEMQVTEIARLEGVTEMGIRKRLRRAFTRLEKQLEQEEDERV